MLKKILSLLNKVTPKQNIILFNSYPAYSDNARALYDYIQKSRSDILTKYKVFWCQSPEDKIPADLGRINFIDKKSLKGICMFLRAKYVVSTHAYFPDARAGHGQIQLNMWHGCGFKRITDADKRYVGNYTVALSDVYRKIQSEDLLIDTDRVYVTGYPRNDLFFIPSTAIEDLGIDKSKYHRIYLWMPTYRKGNEGHTATDGDPNSFGFSTMSTDDLNLLNQTLDENDSFLIVKPHPMDSANFEKANSCSNIICVKNEELNAKGINLYQLMAQCDCLISDYSSCIVDYSILDKPIVIACSDTKEYKANRGFVFSPVEKYFPGPVVSNFTEFTNYIKDPDPIDEKYRSHREKLSNMFHKYKDGNSAERICNIFWPKETSYEKSSTN